MKTCTRCSEEKEATFDYFHKDSKAQDGLANICKDCISLRKKQLDDQKQLLLDIAEAAAEDEHDFIKMRSAPEEEQHRLLMRKGVKLSNIVFNLAYALLTGNETDFIIKLLKAKLEELS